MSNKEFYLYVHLWDKLYCLDIKRLSNSDRPQFKIVHDNSKAEYPIGMGHIVVDSKLYLFGGEKLKVRLPDPHSHTWSGFIRPCDETEGWANTDVFIYDVSSQRLREESSFPRLSATKTRPIVATLDNKIHVLATTPLRGNLREIPPDNRFEILDLEEGVWKPLGCPPFYKLDDDLKFYPPVFQDQIIGHYAWGRKMVVHLMRSSYVFDAVDQKWESAESLDLHLPRLWSAAEYKGQLIGIPMYEECLVAYNLDSSGFPKYSRHLHELDKGLFNPPFQQVCNGSLTLLDDSGHMCLVQLGAFIRFMVSSSNGVASFRLNLY